MCYTLYNDSSDELADKEVIGWKPFGKEEKVKLRRKTRKITRFTIVGDLKELEQETLSETEFELIKSDLVNFLIWLGNKIKKLITKK